jgi:2-haloalkanoic acid dehalogenase type II
MSAITTVIFDMFNTMAKDGPELWNLTFNDIVREQRLNTTPAALRHAWNTGADNFRDRRTAPGAPFISYLDGWADAFDGAFHDLGLSGDGRAASQKSIDDLGTRELWEDTPEALAILQADWRLAIISNADDAYLNPVVSRIPETFAVVVSSETSQCYKPDARLFRAACEEMQVLPTECVYVGDRQFEDVMGAHRVGMKAVWINRSGSPMDPDLPTPEAEIRDLLALPAVLKKLG